MPNLASSEILRSVRHRVNKNLSCYDTELCYVSSCECCLAGAHNLERTTPILGLCHGVFTDGFIFRYILQQFFSAKLEAPFVYDHIRSIYYDEGDQNVIKV